MTLPCSDMVCFIPGEGTNEQVLCKAIHVKKTLTGLLLQVTWDVVLAQTYKCIISI